MQAFRYTRMHQSGLQGNQSEQCLNRNMCNNLVGISKSSLCKSCYHRSMQTFHLENHKLQWHTLREVHFTITVLILLVSGVTHCILPRMMYTACARKTDKSLPSLCLLALTVTADLVALIASASC